MTSARASGAGLVVEPIDPAGEEAAVMYDAYITEISQIFGYDSTRAVPTTEADFAPPNGRLLAVRDESGAALGCGGVRLLDPQTAEIKRMWLHPSLRGRGAGRLLLAALEAQAEALGAGRCVLDTNAALTSAIALYRSTGWQEVPAYNDNAEATHWFAKPLRPSGS